jgi:hypothetical protein
MMPPPKGEVATSSSGNDNLNANGRTLSKNQMVVGMRLTGGSCQCRTGYTWILGNCTIPQQVLIIENIQY